MFHYAWPWLTPLDRFNLTQTHPAILQYANLRLAACTTSISILQQPRPAPTANCSYDTKYSHAMACALLRFNFNYPDLLRWLGGHYTNQHRDWDKVFSTLAAAKQTPVPPGSPVVDFHRTERIMREGAPLYFKGTSSYNDCAARNLHPPSADLLDKAEELDAKLAKEERLRYHVLLPRFCWRFIDGIWLCLFRMAYKSSAPTDPVLRKGHGRICVDPSTTISPDDMGNTNRCIGAPGQNHDENPPCQYGTAFERYLTWLWNLRISYPDELIVQMGDDVSAAFHRILYHPAVAPAFSVCWKSWLIIPVGTIFGAKNSPGLYMLPGELRAHFAAAIDNPASIPRTHLTDMIELPEEPTPEVASAYSKALADSIHQGILDSHSDNPERRYPTFVDDTGVAHTLRHFLETSNCSTFAAFTMFGFPEEDPLRPPAINDKKWQKVVTDTMEFLGYTIDSSRMVVAWPIAKRQRLLDAIDVLLVNAIKGKPCTPRAVAKVTGLLGHAALPAPGGRTRILPLQHSLNDRLSLVKSVRQLRRWYARPSISLTKHQVMDLRHLRGSIDLQYLYANDWCRKIGLLIPRDPGCVPRTDASPYGLGGWSSHLNHMWRLFIEDLRECGLSTPSHALFNPQYWEEDFDPLKLHINILEFIAIFIELWICIRQLHKAHHRYHKHNCKYTLPEEQIPDGGLQIRALADNTSALSWLRYAARTKRRPIRTIAILLQRFLTSPFPLEHIALQGRHLAGKLNDEADRLSRPTLCPSWASVMEEFPALQHLRICLLPRKLLQLLLTALTVEPTEAWFAAATTKLWTIEGPIFTTGSRRPQGMTSSLRKR